MGYEGEGEETHVPKLTSYVTLSKSLNSLNLISLYLRYNPIQQFYNQITRLSQTVIMIV